MTEKLGLTIGIIGAGEVGSQLARAAIKVGYKVVAPTLGGLRR